jgi:hypothetical protein
MRRLYEWEVRVGSIKRLSSCGVADAPMRARRHMLEAVAASPDGQTATGSVTVIELALPHDYYDYFQTIVLVERGTDGAVRWLVRCAIARPHSQTARAVSWEHIQASRRAFRRVCLIGLHRRMTKISAPSDFARGQADDYRRRPGP